MRDDAEKRGQLIRHLEDALALADEIEDGQTWLVGSRFLRQSQHHMDESFIDVYGSYAIKLLKLQTDLLQALDRHRRGHHQTVEVHHVHLYPGSQGVIGVVNPPQDGGEGPKMMDGPMHPQTEPVPLRNARRGTCDGVTSSRFSAARRPLGPSWRARSSRRRRSSALSAPGSGTRETVSLHAFLRSMGSRSMRPRANPPRSERPQRSWFDPPSRA